MRLQCVTFMASARASRTVILILSYLGSDIW